LGWGRRRRNRGRESRQSGYILAFTDENVPSVYPSVSPPVTVPHHYTGIPVWILQPLCRQNHLKKIHVITPLQLFENLYNPSAIQSVYTDGICSSVYTDYIADGNGMSVYTDKIIDEIISISKNYWWKNFIGNSVDFYWFSCSDELSI
jgi:hypothetical protein